MQKKGLWYVKEPLTLNESLDRDPNKKYVSFSQYQQYESCQKRWALNYKEGHRKNVPSIHTVFGEAMHRVVQEWLTCIYEKSSKVADAMELDSMLESFMTEKYFEDKEAYGAHFSDPQELYQFYQTGLEIIQFLKKNRASYFSIKGTDLVGVEVHLVYPTCNQNVMFVGFIDLLFFHPKVNMYSMPDIKTSKSGWSDYEKKDKVKNSQVLLYRHFLSKQYNIPEDSISASFFILRREVNKDAQYPVKRVQEHFPSAGSVSVKRAIDSFNIFVKNCFNDDGSYVERAYPATAGKNSNNCRFCEYKENYELCPKQTRRYE